MSSSLNRLLPDTPAAPTSMSGSHNTPLKAVIFLVIIVSFVWVILYSSTLNVVCAKSASGVVITDSDGKPVIDKSKCLVGAFLVGLLVLICFYLFKRTK